MAAPAFAAAMLEHQVLRTIAVGRHVLLIADVRVEEGAEAAGKTIAELHDGRLARVLALHVPEARDWSPPRDHVLSPGEQIIVVATRAGLGAFLAGDRPVTPSL
jgi:Trk K+ transport system NAD-binding subunit